eukprot:TRINITY_DN1349_c0_g4_i1.p1 TRINITY_DN1349_c0_g4~~TRINITY_DN1349_c0_g4_i1.p1  ORF type:complete len:2965 (+),score=707.36 TRINITY_DN1349_c0_g4_i1:77-8971(+)
MSNPRRHAATGDSQAAGVPPLTVLRQTAHLMGLCLRMRIRNPVLGLTELVFPVLVVLIFCFLFVNVEKDYQSSGAFDLYDEHTLPPLGVYDGQTSNLSTPTLWFSVDVESAEEDDANWRNLSRGVFQEVVHDMMVENGFFLRGGSIQWFNDTRKLASILCDVSGSYETGGPYAAVIFSRDVRPPHPMCMPETFQPDRFASSRVPGLHYIIYQRGLPSADSFFGTMKPYKRSPTLNYAAKGVLSLQFVIDRALARVLVNPSHNFSRLPEDYSIRRFPSAKFPQLQWGPEIRRMNARDVIVRRAGAPMLALSYIVVFSLTMVVTVTAHEIGLKDCLTALGMSPIAHGAAYVSTTMLVNLIPVLVQARLLMRMEILIQVELSFFLMYLMFFLLSVLAAGQLLGVFFRNPSHVSVLSVVVWASVVAVGTKVADCDQSISYDGQESSCTESGRSISAGLLSPVAFILGFREIVLRINDKGQYVGWKTLGSSSNGDTSFDLRNTLGMMIGDAALYFLLAWYFKRASYNGHKVYFPFQTSYWRSGAKHEECPPPLMPTEDREPVKAQPNAYLLQIRGLSASISEGDRFGVGLFSKQHVVLDNLDLDVHSDQILAILGSEGKTAFVNCLSGQKKAEAGKFFLDGVETKPLLHQYRMKIGVSPQRNVLYDCLTACEHLELVGVLKGIPWRQVRAEAEAMAAEVDLLKEHKRAKDFTPGQKKKLQIAMALIGDPRLVLLDEPTADMDPVSMRQIRSLIRKFKRGRIIIMTTKSIVEAEWVADRLAVLLMGRIRCIGSSSFLKRKVGCGYLINVAKRHQLWFSPLLSPTVQDDGTLLTILETTAPNAYVRDSNTDIRIHIPSRYISQLIALLRLLEARTSPYARLVKSWALKAHGLEDIYLHFLEEAIMQVACHSGHIVEPTKRDAVCTGTADGRRCPREIDGLCRRFFCPRPQWRMYYCVTCNSFVCETCGDYNKRHFAQARLSTERVPEGSSQHGTPLRPSLSRPSRHTQFWEQTNLEDHIANEGIDFARPQRRRRRQSRESFSENPNAVQEESVPPAEALVPNCHLSFTDGDKPAFLSPALACLHSSQAGNFPLTLRNKSSAGSTKASDRVASEKVLLGAPTPTDQSPSAGSARTRGEETVPMATASSSPQNYTGRRETAPSSLPSDFDRFVGASPGMAELAESMIHLEDALFTKEPTVACEPDCGTHPRDVALPPAELDDVHVDVWSASSPREDHDGVDVDVAAPATPKTPSDFPVEDPAVAGQNPLDVVEEASGHQQSTEASHVMSTADAESVTSLSGRAAVEVDIATTPATVVEREESAACEGSEGGREAPHPSAAASDMEPEDDSALPENANPLTAPDKDPPPSDFGSPQSTPSLIIHPVGADSAAAWPAADEVPLSQSSSSLGSAVRQAEDAIAEVSNLTMPRPLSTLGLGGSRTRLRSSGQGAAHVLPRPATPLEPVAPQASFHSSDPDDAAQSDDDSWEDVGNSQNLLPDVIFTPGIPGGARSYRQLYALVRIKRSAVTRVNKHNLLFHQVLPLIFVLAGILVLEFLSAEMRNNPSITMRPTLISQPMADSNFSNKFVQLPVLGMSSMIDTHGPQLCLDSERHCVMLHDMLPEQGTVRNLTVHSASSAHMPIGSVLEVNGPKTTIWFNASALHVLPAMMNVLANLELNTSLAAASGMNYTDRSDLSQNLNRLVMNNTQIHTTLHTVPEGRTENAVPVLAFSVLAAFGVSFITSSFAVQIVIENRSGFRLLQQTAGLSTVVYWLGHYIWDSCASAVLSAVITSLFLAFYPMLRTTANVLAMLVVTYLYFQANIAIVYTAAQFVQTPWRAQALVAFVLMISMFIPLILSVSISSSGGTFLKQVEPLSVFVFNPLYALINAWLTLTKHVPSGTGGGVFHSVEKPAQGLLVEYVVGWVVLALVEARRPLLNRIKQLFPRPPGFYVDFGEDVMRGGLKLDDAQPVEEERREVERRRLGGNIPLCGVVAYQLRKLYRTGSQKIAALQSLDLMIPPGEVFALLGPTGAGKTTTTKLLTGEIAPTQGEAFFEGKSILGWKEHLWRSMGVCLQNSALIDELTVMQHVELFAVLRGIPRPFMTRVIHEFLHALDLHRYRSSYVLGLNESACRRLSLLLAFLGKPKFLILDEPTSRMDLVSRKCSRKFMLQWMKQARGNKDGARLGGAAKTAALSAALRKRGEAPVMFLTTHSLEEVQMIATRVGILVQGRLRKLGKLQHLCEKYGSSWSLAVRTSNDLNSHAFTKCLQQTVADTRIISSRAGATVYSIPKQVKISSVFSFVERGRERFQIDDYGVNHMSLEEVFFQTVLDDDEQLMRWAHPIPPLNVVILVVGTRGDVQPFLVLALRLAQEGHHVRIASHAKFKSFVEGEVADRLDSSQYTGGVEFFPLAGDPNEMMAFMVENPDCITLDINKIKANQVMMGKIFDSCWAACTTPADFIIDVLIANPPTQCHTHIVEKLQVDLQVHFTMPFSATAMYPNPLAVTTKLGNYKSYALVEKLWWLGLGAQINEFRTNTLGLAPMNQGDGLAAKMEVPHVYCMSEYVIKRPSDWGQHIHITGNWFLPKASEYVPPTVIADFVYNGTPPLYIGFGSIVLPSSAGSFTSSMSEGIDMLLMKHVALRVILHKSSGACEFEPKMSWPSNRLMILTEPVDHAWLFPLCCVVVHHGGAGTVAAGLAAGCPAVIIPFFGDQHFWGRTVEEHCCGVALQQKDLTPTSFCDAVIKCLDSTCLIACEEMGRKLKEEDGVAKGVAAFYSHLPLVEVQVGVDVVYAWEVCCYENQRFYPCIGWTDTLLASDPLPWCCKHGKLAATRYDFRLPKGWKWIGDWHVDKDRTCDASGFQYASSWDGMFHNRRKVMDFVRRRRWVRRRIYSPEQEGSQSVEFLHNQVALLQDMLKQKQQQVDALRDGTLHPRDLLSTTYQGKVPIWHSPHRQWEVTGSWNSGSPSAPPSPHGPNQK